MFTKWRKIPNLALYTNSYSRIPKYMCIGMAMTSYAVKNLNKQQRTQKPLK